MIYKTFLNKVFVSVKRELRQKGHFKSLQKFRLVNWSDSDLNPVVPALQLSRYYESQQKSDPTYNEN